MLKKKHQSMVLKGEHVITNLMVRDTGLEPARPCGHQILSLVRLPISSISQIRK